MLISHQLVEHLLRVKLDPILIVFSRSLSSDDLCVVDQSFDFRYNTKFVNIIQFVFTPVPMSKT